MAFTAQWVGNMSSAGVQGFTFHIEATQDPIGCIRKIKEAGMKVRTVQYFGPISIFIYLCNDLNYLIHALYSIFAKVGVALKPKTAVETILGLLEHSEDPLQAVDMVLVMTVEPGFGGQSFMREQTEKVRALRRLRPTLDIEVDGGVGPSTVQFCADVRSLSAL